MAAPGETRDLVKALRRQLLTAGRPCDDRFGFHVEGELARRAVGHRIGVFRGLLARIGRLGRDLEPAQPLHVHVALETGQQQAQRITLLRTQPLTVLAVDQHGVVETFFDRDRARQRGGIGAFGDDPLGARLQACFIQHGLQRHAGPFRAAHQTDEVGGGLAIGLGVDRVAGALDEVDSRLRGKAADVLHREHQRTIDHAVQHQPVLGRIDGRHAAVVAFVEQAVRRDDAVELLQRRAARSGDILRERLRDVLDDALFVYRWRAVGLAPHRVAGRFHPFRHAGRKIIPRLGKRRRTGNSRDRGAAGQCRTRLKESPARRLSHALVRRVFAHRRFPLTLRGAA